MLSRLMALAVLLPALISSAFDAGHFTIADSGAILIDGLRFETLCATKQEGDWRPHRALQETALTPAPGFPKREGGAFRVEGAFATPPGNYRFTETLTVKPDLLTAEFQLATDGELPSQGRILQADLPHEWMSAHGGIRIDGKEITFPRHKVDPENWRFSGWVKKLEIPLENGWLTLEGKLYCYLEDRRKGYNQKVWSLNFHYQPVPKKKGERDIKATFRYQPYRFEAVSLAAAANLDFKDEVAGDGKGGWSDQGPRNDLRMFPVKQRRFAGVDFEVVDPAKNGGRAVIGLYDKARAAGSPRSVDVKVNGRAGEYLYLLHAMAFDLPKGVKIGTIRVAYADGSRQEIPVKSGEDIGNFWNPVPRSNAAIGWRGVNPSAPVGVLVSGFKLSGKPVATLTFESAGAGIWLIAGASLGNQEVPQPRSESVYIVADKDFQPIKADKMVEPGSILDFSMLLDAPAGKYGPVRNVGGRFEFEGRPGVPVRFWGGNLTYGINFTSKENCEKLAGILAKMGYNLVRYHHFDQQLWDKKANDSTVFDPVMLDRLDYMLATMKKHGL